MFTRTTHRGRLTPGDLAELHARVGRPNAEPVGGRPAGTLTLVGVEARQAPAGGWDVTERFGG